MEQRQKQGLKRQSEYIFRYTKVEQYTQAISAPMHSLVKCLLVRAA